MSVSEHFIVAGVEGHGGVSCDARIFKRLFVRDGMSMWWSGV